MANVKITDLTALSGALADADLFEMVDDVAGTPASRKVTASVLKTYVNNNNASGFSAYADGTNTQNLTTGTGTTLISGSSGALRTVEWNINSYFNTTSGIFFPTEAGLWLIGATGVIDSMNDGKYMAVYIAHSTDGSTWSDTNDKACLAWRGASSAASMVIGGSGSFIVASNGTTDRWALRIFHNDAGTPKIPGTTSNRDWCRFWAKRIGSTS